MPRRFLDRLHRRQDFGRHEAFDEVVVAQVADALGDADAPGNEQCFEDGPGRARRRPPPINRMRMLVKVGGREWPALGQRRRLLTERKEAAVAAVRKQLELLRVDDLSAARLLTRPEVSWQDVVGRFPELTQVDAAVAEQVEYDIKYAGYIARQDVDVARQQRLADKRIPADLDYHAVRQLRAEAREKLTRVRPASLAQASRISGITPADVALVLAYLEG